MPTTSATSSTSATANLVSTLGAGSGINMSQLAEQLAAAQYAARLDQITAKTDKITSQISSASTLRSMITSLASSLGDRVRTGDLAATPQIANASVAQVSKGAATGRGTTTLDEVPGYFLDHEQPVYGTVVPDHVLRIHAAGNIHCQEQVPAGDRNVLDLTDPLGPGGGR